MIFLIILLLNILSISQSVILLKGVLSLKKCVNYFQDKKELVNILENMITSMSLTHEYIYEFSSWENGVNEGLIPLSEQLKKLACSNDINNENFQKYIKLASSKIDVSCQITGCIVQASQAGESIIDAGANIRLAGESLKDTSHEATSQFIVDAGESILIFGQNLLKGEFK